MAEWAASAERARLLAGALVAVEGALEVFDPEHMGFNHAKASALRERILEAMGEG